MSCAQVYSDPVLYKRAQDLGICLVDYDFFNKLNVQNGYGEFLSPFLLPYYTAQH